MKILVLPGSLRAGSLNKQLARWVSLQIPQIKKGTETLFLDLQPLNIPVYDGDIENKGIPSSVLELAEKIRQHDGLIICSPEYNGSISSVLKNTIDWVSRVKPNCFDRKPVLLMAASPGALGGVRALWHERVPLEALGAFVSPNMHGLSKAHEKFDAQGTLTDEAAVKAIQALLSTFLADIHVSV